LGKEIEKFENNSNRQDSTIAKNCKKFTKKFEQIGNEITSKSTSNLNLKNVLQSMQHIDKEILALDIIQDAKEKSQAQVGNKINTYIMNKNTPNKTVPITIDNVMSDVKVLAKTRSIQNLVQNTTRIHTIVPD